MKYIPINWDIISNPYNWVVVGLMVAILMLSLHLIFGTASPSTPGDAA